MAPQTRIGFLGLGTMGIPMALNLSRRHPLTVWNRTPTKYPLLTQAGAGVADSPAAVAGVADSPAAVAERSDVVFSMLYDGAATEAAVLAPAFARAVRGKILVNAASVTADCSARLAAGIAAAGGRFVEMPVSGSKVPAERGRLVCMLAGDRATAEGVVGPLVEGTVARAAVYCGPIGAGLKTKFATNLFLIGMTAGLAEAMSLAEAQGVDLETFGRVLEAGPMASAYSRLKVGKIVGGDWAPQAAIKDCWNSTRLICEAAEGAGVRSPVARLCEALYREANEAGLGEEDMIAVHKLTRLTKS